MEAKKFAEDAVREFLLFRGFTDTLQSFESELHAQCGSGFYLLARVDRILMLMRDYVQRFEAERLVDLLAFLKSRVTKSGDVQLQQTATALERSLKRYYIVYAMQNGRKDKVLEFFGKYGKSLLRSGDPDWNAWFALYKSGSEEAILKEEERQMDEYLKAKNEELANLIKNSTAVPEYWVESPPPTPPRSNSSRSSGFSSQESVTVNEADYDADTDEDSSSDFSISLPRSAPVREASQKIARTRVTYTCSFKPERNEISNSWENAREVFPVAVQHQELFTRHLSPITRCRYSTTGANIASASQDGTVSIWAPNVSSSVAVSHNATICGGAEVLSLEWTEQLLFLGTAERRIKGWNVETKRVVCDLTTEAMFPRVLDLKCSPTDPVFCCAAATEIIPSGEGVHGLGYGSLTIWNMHTLQATTALELGQEPPVMTSACFNDNGKILAAGATDGKIRIFDLREKNSVAGWPAYNGCAVSCVRFGQDQNSVFSLGANGKIIEWSMRKKSQIQHRGKYAKSYSALASGILPRNEFAISPSGRHVLLTSNTTTAPLYHWDSSMTQRSLAHEAAITSVDWHPASPMTFLTGSADHSVRITAAVDSME
ncbi:hypothetical protein KC19_8G142100 [Ceratodon purpureus]|uniref:WD repeat-containing protein 91 n=1 Tax=Ceratodon purpureus TaxID=3225 RepID=A0A8T0H3A1_CERPU|nr:hypothetical protein KC19_8G142100 [Ceratodon purpureus]